MVLVDTHFQAGKAKAVVWTGAASLWPLGLLFYIILCLSSPYAVRLWTWVSCVQSFAVSAP